MITPTKHQQAEFQPLAAGVEFLGHCSQQLWNEGSFKGLVKRFVNVLQTHFEAEQFSYLNLSGLGKKRTFKAGTIRIPGARPIDDDHLNALKEQLLKLDLTTAEYRDGYASLECRGVNLQFVLVDEPNEEPEGDKAAVAVGPGGMGLIVWKEGPLAAKNWAAVRAGGQPMPVGAMALHLDFLVRQLQSECRWFRKLDSTQALLYRDELTGLFNYRYLDIAIDSELRRSQRFRTSFCLLFIDLDNFKPINDKHGHLSGSSVLKQVAHELRLVVREVDSIIRYGGDEYVVVLLGATSASALLAAERIRRQIAEKEFITEDGSRVHLTASIGVAACPEHTEDKEALLKLADETMYRSKRGGKNRVSIVGGAVKDLSEPNQGILGDRNGSKS